MMKPIKLPDGKEKCCGTCKHWVPEGELGNVGACLRYPPTGETCYINRTKGFIKTQFRNRCGEFDRSWESFA